MALFPLGPQPDVVGSDMKAAADRIIEIDTDR